MKITGRFLTTTAVFLFAILGGVTLVTLQQTLESQRKLVEDFTTQLEGENQEQRTYIQEVIRSKASALASSMAHTAVNLILNYDHDTLRQITEFCSLDPDISFLVFYDENDDPITQPAAANDEGHILTQAILSEGEQIGRLELGLNFASVEIRTAAVGERIEKLTQEAIRAQKAEARLIVLKIAVVSACGLVAMCLFTYFILRRIVIRPIKDVIGAIEQLGSISEGTGDLTVRLEIDRRDEIGEMARWFNMLIEKLGQLVDQVKHSSGEMASLSEQLATTTSEIAHSNQKVSSQAGTVAASSDEMNVTVGEMSERASVVSSAAGRAREVSADGSLVISDAVHAIVDIASVVTDAAATVQVLGDESKKIGTIIEVIEDIADQTNLLALNAAIEAARAGEHGRGFAVVADEVRKLAEKTVRATHEINSTISVIQEQNERAVGAMGQGRDKADRGTELAESAGQAIAAIESESTRATEQVEQIAASTEQLAATIRHIVQNIDDMSKGVQLNASAAVEIASTSESLAHKAEELKAFTQGFQT